MHADPASNQPVAIIYPKIKKQENNLSSSKDIHEKSCSCYVDSGLGDSYL